MAAHRFGALLLLLITAAGPHARASGDGAAQQGPPLPTCSGDVAAQQAQLFQQAKQANAAWTACPKHAWLGKFSELVSASGSAQATVIFDVGCNKGYESASVFDHLAPSLGLNPASLYRHYQRSKVQLESLCGTCGNCHERAHVLLRPERSAVQVHCFEPGAVNYEVLQAARQAFFGGARRAAHPRARNMMLAWTDPMASSSAGDAAPHRAAAAAPAHSWVLQHMAVGGAPGVVDFPKGCKTTRCSIHAAGDKVAVNVTTVDSYALQHGLAHIDLLKVDAEGHDPAALDGAAGMLQRKAVGLLLFEYNDIGLWRSRPLSSLVGQLQGHGYACYYDGSPNLTRLTRCWHDSYDLRTWSNVVCAPDGSAYARMLEGLSFLQTHGLLLLK